MSQLQRLGRIGASAMLIASMAACSSALGNVLGGVLGGLGGGNNEVTGSIQQVNTSTQQIAIVQTNGQSVSVGYDNSTSVVYNNQNYPVTALQNGDQVTARVQQLQNGGYYTDLITVTQSVGGSTGTTGNVVSIEGTVQQVDRTNGWFTLNTNTGAFLTVTMPYNPRSTDATRFSNLRSGDYVRLYGTYLNNTRVQLSQFY